MTQQNQNQFEISCSYFRKICYEIRSFTNLTTFKGSYNQVIEFLANEQYKSKKGVRLLNALIGCANFCQYNGKKINLSHPQWWYVCWENENADGDDDNGSGEITGNIDRIYSYRGITTQIYTDGSVVIFGTDLNTEKYQLKKDSQLSFVFYDTYQLVVMGTTTDNKVFSFTINNQEKSVDGTVANGNIIDSKTTTHPELALTSKAFYQPNENTNESTAPGDDQENGQTTAPDDDYISETIDNIKINWNEKNTDKGWGDIDPGTVTKSKTVHGITISAVRNTQDIPDTIYKITTGNTTKTLKSNSQITKTFYNNGTIIIEMETIEDYNQFYITILPDGSLQNGKITPEDSTLSDIITITSNTVPESDQTTDSFIDDFFYNWFIYQSDNSGGDGSGDGSSDGFDFVSQYNDALRHKYDKLFCVEAFAALDNQQQHNVCEQTLALQKDDFNEQNLFYDVNSLQKYEQSKNDNSDKSILNTYNITYQFDQNQNCYLQRKLLEIDECKQPIYLQPPVPRKDYARLCDMKEQLIGYRKTSILTPDYIIKNYPDLSPSTQLNIKNVGLIKHYQWFIKQSYSFDFYASRIAPNIQREYQLKQVEYDFEKSYLSKKENLTQKEMDLFESNQLWFYKKYPTYQQYIQSFITELPEMSVIDIENSECKFYSCGCNEALTQAVGYGDVCFTQMPEEILSNNAATQPQVCDAYLAVYNVTKVCETEGQDYTCSNQIQTATKYMYEDITSQVLLTGKHKILDFVKEIDDYLTNKVVKKIRRGCYEHKTNGELIIEKQYINYIASSLSMQDALQQFYDRYNDRKQYTECHFEPCNQFYIDIIKVNIQKYGTKSENRSVQVLENQLVYLSDDQSREYVIKYNDTQYDVDVNSDGLVLLHEDSTVRLYKFHKGFSSKDEFIQYKSQNNQQYYDLQNRYLEFAIGKANYEIQVNKNGDSSIAGLEYCNGIPDAVVYAALNGEGFITLWWWCSNDNVNWVDVWSYEQTLKYIYVNGPFQQHDGSGKKYLIWMYEGKNVKTFASYTPTQADQMQLTSFDEMKSKLTNAINEGLSSLQNYIEDRKYDFTEKEIYYKHENTINSNITVTVLDQRQCIQRSLSLTLDANKKIPNTSGVLFRIHIVEENGVSQSIYRVPIEYGAQTIIFYASRNHENPGVDQKITKTAYIIAEKYF